MRVTSPAGPAAVDDIVSIFVFIEPGMRWSMGPKPKILGRYADGWVTVDRSMFTLGKPGMKIEATLSSAGATLLATGTTPADPSGRYELTASARPDEIIDLSTGPTNVAADEIAGRVVDPAGRPVAGAVVSLPRLEFPGSAKVPAQLEAFRPATKTDADGVFRFGDFARQWFLYLQVDAPGYAARRLVDLPVGRPFTIKLDDQTRLVGSLESADGKPSGPATIELVTSKPTARPRIANPISDITLVVKTDDKGQYDVPIEPGTYDVRITSSAGDVARHPAIEIASGQTVMLPPTLDGGVTLKVRAVDSHTGAAVPGVHFALRGQRPGLMFEREGTGRTSDAAGVAAWDHLTAGTEGMIVRADGYSRWWVDTGNSDDSRIGRGISDLRVEVKPDMPEILVKMEPAVRVTGTVLAPDGTPVANATIDIAGLLTGDSRYATHTDAHGKFKVNFPVLNDVQRPPSRRPAGRPDELTIAMLAFDTTGNWANTLSEPFTPKSGDAHDFTLKMTLGGRVSGRVIDAASKKPVAGIEVEAVPEDDMDRQYYNPRQVTDAAGHFDLGPMRATAYQIRADTHFGVNVSSEPPQKPVALTVVEGEEQADVTIPYNGPPPPPVPAEYFRYGGNRRITATTRPAVRR